MLQSMRDGAQSWVLKTIFIGLLVLATAGLVLMDVGSFFRDGAPTTVAFEIEGQEFTTVELDRLVTAELRNQNLSLAQGLDQGIVDKIIEREVQSRLLLVEARDLGIRVSDTIVADQVRAMMDSMMGENAPVDEDSKAAVQQLLFQQYLNNLGLSEGQFVQYQKGQIASGMISNALFRTDFKPESYSQYLLAFENETRDAGMYKVRISDSEIPNPSDEDLQVFYDENKELYRTDELRSFSMISLTHESVLKELAIDEDLLREEYETRKSYGDYTTKGSRLLSQATLGTKEEAEKVLKAAKSKNDLRKAVEEVTGGTAAYITADRYARGELPKDIEEPVFSTSKKGLIGPLETGLGWFVVDLQDITKEETKSYNSVKQEIEADLKETRAADLLFETAYDVEDMLAGGATLEEVAKDMNLEMKTYADVDRSANIIGSKQKNNKIFDEDDIVGSRKVLKAVYETDEGLSTQLVENENGDFIIAFVDKVTPSVIPAFEDVQSELKKDWKENKKRELSREKANELITAYAETGDGIDFKTYKGIPRLTALGRENKSALDDLEVASLFQLQEINELVNLPDDEGHVIVKLNKVNVPAIDLSDTSLIEQKGNIARSFKEDIARDYFKALRDNMDITINDDTIALFYKKRLEQNY